jgi:hypothetical protein
VCGDHDFDVVELSAGDENAGVIEGLGLGGGGRKKAEGEEG